MKHFDEYKFCESAIYPPYISLKIFVLICLTGRKQRLDSFIFISNQYLLKRQLYQGTLHS